MFDTLGERLNTALDGVRGSGNLTEDQVKKVTREIRLALLEADVNYGVVKEFVGNVRERATGAEVSKALSPGQQVVKIVNEELANLMGGEAHKLTFASRPPTVVMLAGLNGHGKTTTAGKLALFVRKLGKSPYLVACDTYRPAGHRPATSSSAKSSGCRSTPRARTLRRKRSPSGASRRRRTVDTTSSSWILRAVRFWIRT